MKKTCPICKKPEAPEHSPFCSKRCADIDLGHWFQGSYAIKSNEEPDEEAIIEAISSGNYKGDLPQS